jgi:hypothetical protein
MEIYQCFTVVYKRSYDHFNSDGLLQLIIYWQCEKFIKTGSIAENYKINIVKLQTFAMVHNVALIFFMGDHLASG